MKLFKLLSLFIAITITANSQIKKDQFLVGGKVSFSAMNYGQSPASYYKTTTLLLSPNLGYFIIDKLAAGVRLQLGYFHQSFGLDKYRTSNTTLSPFIRYYFLPAAKMVNALIDISYDNYKTTSTNQYLTANTTRSYGYTISAGPSIFLSQHIALEFTVGYQYKVPKGFPIDKATQFNTGFGLQIHLGKIKIKPTA